MAGSAVTVRALAAVIQHELPLAMETMIRDLQHVKLDLERSRMGGEDLLSRYMSYYTQAAVGQIAWKGRGG